MARNVWIVDPKTGYLFEPLQYARLVDARRGRCRTGSPQSHHRLGRTRPLAARREHDDVSRRDLREQEAKHDVRCAGDAGYLESLKTQAFQPTDRKAHLHRLLNETEPVPEQIKARLEGRLSGPAPLAGPMETV